MLKLNKHLISFYFSVILFRVLLEASYFFVVSVDFAYEGYKYSFLWSNYLLSWLVFFVSLFMLQDRLKKVSDYFFITAILGVLTPLCVMYGLDDQREIFPLFTSLLALFSIWFITRLRLLTFKTLPVVNGGISLSLVISSVFVLFLVFWFLRTGVTFNLDLTKVYEFRNANADLAMQGIFSYTNNWTYQIFNLVLFAFALIYRRYFLALVIFSIQVYFFAASTHKSVLFFPFIILGLWYYFRKTNSLAVVPLMFSSVIALTLLTYYWFGDLWASSLFSRRVFFVPAHLTFTYFEFFSQNPHVVWSNSVLSSFLSYPYDISMSHVIGRFLGSEDMGANNGFVASGYAHAGLFGVFFYALIIGLILRFINDVTHNLLPLWFAIALCIVPLRNLLISSDLFTVMLTHGFIVALIIIFLARSKKYAQFK